MRPEIRVTNRFDALLTCAPRPGPPPCLIVPPIIAISQKPAIMARGSRAVGTITSQPAPAAAAGFGGAGDRRWRRSNADFR